MLNSLPSMKRKVGIALLGVILGSLPLLAQEKLYPVRQGLDVRVLIMADRSRFSVERAFQHKLTVGFPNDDEVAFIPKTRTPLILLWVRIQNTSTRPVDVDITKFSSTDDAGRKSSALSIEEATKKIVEGASGGSLGSKTLRGISLGRVGSAPTEDQLKDDIQRYSLQSGQMQPGAVRDGLIYFEAPQKKKFTVSIVLGDLWSLPLVFSTEKQK